MYYYLNIMIKFTQSICYCPADTAMTSSNQRSHPLSRSNDAYVPLWFLISWSHLSPVPRFVFLCTTTHTHTHTHRPTHTPPRTPHIHTHTHTHTHTHIHSHTHTHTHTHTYTHRKHTHTHKHVFK